MNRINILDASLADKIAAGEVVERPSSVIKELVENSIDAKATKIDIFVVDGGRTLIEVKDNGIGMSKEDAKLSIKRHATSKIKFDQDLFSIKTMGFRGEALSAISSVSRFTLITKEKDAPVGTKLFCINSEVISIDNCPYNQGTDIKVEELFYNTPARLKYLKADTTELSYISDIVNKLALANPHIAFSLTSNDKMIFKTSGKNDQLEIIASIYGLNVAKSMIPFHASNNDFEISGYTSKISTSRANRYAITTFMNNRIIKNKTLSDCIIDGYHELLFENRYPYTVLHINTDATLLDVNVHPTKQEIRISKEGELREFIKSTIHNALINANQVIENKIEKVKENKSFQGFIAFNEAPVLENTNVINEPDAPYQAEQTSIKFEDEKIINKDYEIIGQIHGTYIIAQSKDGFILVDQHAAAERIRYERYKKLFKEPSHITDMLVPMIIELPSNEYQTVKDNLELLNKVYIYAEDFGSNAIKITSIPYFFKHVNMKAYVEDCIEQIITNRKISENELIDYAIATAACKASIKGNSYLSLQEMETIISDLFKCQDPYTCPHGRPTMVSYTKYELEKFFKRVV